MSNIVKQFNQTPITFNDDGWFNATEAAKAFGKRPNDWLALPSTIEYLEFLSASTKNKVPLVKAQRGGASKGGTWVHPDAGVEFARWLNPGFAAWMQSEVGRADLGRTIAGHENFLSDWPDAIRNRPKRPEFVFGEEIVERLFSGYTIIRQFPVFGGKYKIDWYVPELRLAIEFDEAHHTSPKNSAADAARQAEIEAALGCRFLRYKHEE